MQISQDTKVGGALLVRERAGAGVLILVVVVLLLGFGAGFAWRWRTADRAEPKSEVVEAAAEVRLGDGARAVLRGLGGAVEIRYVALMGDAETAKALGAFLQRVDALLGAFEREGAGRVRVNRQTTWSVEASRGASAAGIRPYDATREEPSYLGLVVTAGGKSEVIPKLQPEWETALESDLARLVARVAAPAPPPVATVDPAISEAAAARVRQTIQNPATVSVEDGKKALRESALKQFGEAVKAMQDDLLKAQEQVAEAERSQSEPNRQAAVAHLKEVQATHSAKLSELARQSQAEVDAWTRMKAP